MTWFGPSGRRQDRRKRVVTYLRQLNRATQIQRMQFIDERELLGALNADEVADSRWHGCYLGLLSIRWKRELMIAGNRPAMFVESDGMVWQQLPDGC
jgi:hypothetical protein